MNWIECESINYSGFSKLTLYRSDDKEFLSFVMEVGLDEVSTVTKGTYLHVWVKGQEDQFFAVSVPDRPGVLPFKIYREKENPFPVRNFSNKKPQIMSSRVTVNSVNMLPLDTSTDPQDGTIIVDLDMSASIPAIAATSIPIQGTFHALGKVPGGNGVSNPKGTGNSGGLSGDVTYNKLFKLKQDPKIVKASATGPDDQGIVTVNLELIITSKDEKNNPSYSHHDKMTKRIFFLQDPPSNLSAQTDVTAEGDPCSGDEDTVLEITMQFIVDGGGLTQKPANYLPTE
jgi:hypothetical protein